MIATEEMHMTPYVRYTATIWTFLSLLDDGQFESPEAVASYIEDGTLFGYLGQKYGIDTSLLTEDDQQVVIEKFRDLLGVDTRRKFGVEKNGLAILIAFCTEGIQQSISD